MNEKDGMQDVEALKKRYEPSEVKTVGSERQICMARFSPCGKWLAGGGYDALIRRWDFTGEEPAEIAPLKGHHGWVQNLGFHPNGGTLFAADSWGMLAAWPYEGENLEPKWSVPEAHDGWIRSLAISEDGSLLATGGRDGGVKVWNAADGALVQEFEGHPHEVYSVGIHPDGKSVVSGDLMGMMKHWDVAGGKLARELEIPEMHFYERIQDVAGLRLVGFEDGGETLVCAGSEPSRAGRAYGIPTVRLYDWKSLKLNKALHQGEASDGFVFDLARHPDGFFMLATSGTPGNGKLFFRRIEDEEPFVTNKKMNNCHSLAVHPDGRRLVVAATNRSSQGNGAVLDKEGNYKGNTSPLHVLEFPGEEKGEGEDEDEAA